MAKGRTSLVVLADHLPLCYVLLLVNLLQPAKTRFVTRKEMGEVGCLKGRSSPNTSTTTRKAFKTKILSGVMCPAPYVQGLPLG